MANYQDFLKNVTDFALRLHDNDTLKDDLKEFIFRKEKELNTLLETGSYPDSTLKVKKERITNVSKQPNGEEFKENKVDSKESPKKEETSRSTRSKAFKDAQNDLNIIPEKIKQEKLSDASVTSMPPPKQPVRKLKTKKASTAKVKHERESDIIIQLPHISIISLSDSDDEQEKPIRSTRTKTKALAEKKKQMKENNAPQESDLWKTKTIKKEKSFEKPKICNETFSEENLRTDKTISNNDNNSNDVEKIPVRSTRTKTRAMAANTTKKEQPNVVLEKGPYKRSQSPLDSNQNKRKKSNDPNDVVNETYVKTPTKPASIANETVVIPREQRMIVTTPQNKQVPIDDLLTDDENDGIYTKSKGTTTKKPLFSQYDVSPVKKRVEAFEKLGAEIAAKTQTTSKKNKLKEISSKPSSAVKSKQITPLKIGIPIYTNASSSSKTKSALKNALPPKTISALKTSQQEYIDREARRREKEQEALRKKEALLQAKQEEIKRKNEEKQLKVANLKAKQEAEEIERLKEQQRQARIKKMNLKMQPSQKKKPLYMDMTAPLLPLDDCFDSDEEQEKVERPNWTRTRNLYPSLMKIHYAGMDFTNTFFMRKAASPNLEDLFGPMNSQKLKRTSSAVWTKPPRFTLMPILQHYEDMDEV